MSKVFDFVGSLSPGRSVFDLSHEKKMTADMGYIYPVMCDEMVPGDKFKIGHKIIIRMMPLVAPILHQIDASIHLFFVPYRILWTDWEDFITGGADGQNAAVLPRWNPGNTAEGSLWDYMGFPTGIVPTDALPLDFVRRAYNRVYNEFYRDQNLIAEVAETNETILKRAWEKDYFTSALPWQQRGIAPSLPISGTSHAVWPDADFVNAAGTALGASVVASTKGIYINSATGRVNVKDTFNDNVVDLSSATTFNVSDLRLAFQVQKWLERNARAGARYTEFLKAHYGVSPRDERLQRPEYIGGNKFPVIISEVLQTSSTDATTPQGNLAGHGITAGNGFTGEYKAEEFGLVIGLLSIMPKPAYQQGIDRQWLRRSRYDFYSPEFANLSEQAIERAEVYASAVGAENRTIFGYQGRFDEMRVKRNQVCGKLRSTLDYWHLGRQFAAAPLLNQAFVECDPRKDVFAVPEEPGMVVSVANIIKAIRPLPAQSEPGMIDHS